MRLRDEEVLVVAMIADQREAFGAARQIVAVIAGHAAGRHVDVLADQQLRTGRLAVRIAGIARVELPAAVRTQSVDRVEIQRRRAEILDRRRVGLLLADRGQIQRDVVIDELTEIGEARRDVGVVAGRIAGVRRPSSRRRAPAADRRRPRAAARFGNIRPNMPGSSCPDRVSRNCRVGCRPAVPWPG